MPPDGSRCPSKPRVVRGEEIPSEFQIPLRGPSGEPVDLVRTFMSHGVADLLPGRVDEAARSYTTTLALPRTQPRTVCISEGRPGFARVEIEGRKLGQRAADNLTAAVRRILNLDEDLSEFYALVADDPDLSWAAAGAGRMLRTPTVFEAAIKTITTTNVAWSATVRMVTALVEHLGESGASGARAFPTPMRWRPSLRASIGRPSEPGTAARTSMRSHLTWSPASSRSKRLARTTTSLTMKSLRAFWPFRGSGRMALPI
jgi:hypothetical protein